MIKSLRESKAKLSELVERASQGEDVLITVRGKVKARLTSATQQTDQVDMRRWAAELEQLQASVATGSCKLRTEDIFSEDRGERD